MFELKKYKETGHFLFKTSDNLSHVWNAPKECSGKYLIYALEKGQVLLSNLYASVGVSSTNRTNKGSSYLPFQKLHRTVALERKICQRYAPEITQTSGNFLL